MKVNVYSTDLRAYDIQRFDIRLGVEVRVELENPEPNIDWFSNFDSVLMVADVNDDNKRTIKATRVGSSVVKIMAGDTVRKTFEIVVYDESTETVDLSMENVRLK